MPDALFCVEQGLIRLSVAAANGREAVLATLQPGMWFAEISAILGVPRLHEASAIEETRLLVVPEEALRALLAKHPQYAAEFLELVCWRYKAMMGRITSSILLPLPIRLARQLMHGAARTKAGRTGIATVELRSSQEDLARMLGVSRQGVNRQLKEWEAQGIIRLQYGRVVVIDPARLAVLATESAC